MSVMEILTINKDEKNWNILQQLILTWMSMIRPCLILSKL